MFFLQLIDYSTSGPKFAPRSFHTLLCSSDVEPQQHYKPYKLRRGKRLESSKASYYRRRCTDGQQKKSFKTSDDDSFIQESVFIPKSATWSCGLGSSCISDSDRPEIVHQSKSHLTKSKSCINLYSNELEKCEYREWRSSALQKFVIKSLPNDLNTITVNNVPQKISASLEKSLVITGTILDESHRKVLSRAASIDVHLRSQEIDNSLSLSDRGPADSARLERKDIKVVNLQSTYRSPSHIRSRSDAGVVSKTTASVSQKSEAITNCSNHSTIPMSSSLPSNLQNETEEKLDESKQHNEESFKTVLKLRTHCSLLSFRILQSNVSPTSEGTIIDQFLVFSGFPHLC